MRQFLIDFNERCKEVEEYLSLIQFYDDIATNKKPKLSAINHYGNLIEYSPSKQTQQILRSSFYIIIYNLIEATTNSIITAVIDQINDERVPLVKLNNQIRILYVRNRLHSRKDDEKKINNALEVIQHIEKGRYVNIDGFNFKVSGNVDFGFINDVIRQIGCIGRQNINSEDILKIAFSKTKNHRNTLAHGNELFSKMGSSLVLADIEKEYNEIKAYLDQVLKNLEKYLDDKKYLKCTT